MTNAHDFSLDAELAETSGWALDDGDDLQDPADDSADDARDADGWESGYGDDDPELTTGEQDLAERYALRRVDRKSVV